MPSADNSPSGRSRADLRDPCPSSRRRTGRPSRKSAGRRESMATATPEVSVIVVNWNGKHLLEGCLASLRCQAFRDFEVILVDNGSSDASVAWAAARYPEVR